MRTVKTYNENFKKSCVEKLLRPDSAGLNATASKCNIPSSTLYTWKMKYASHTPMTKNKKIKTLDDWTPEQKLDAAMKTYSMTDEELGQYLRSNGLHSSDLETIKKDFLSVKNSKGRPKIDPEVVELRKQNKALKSDIKRKDTALAEYSARVILLKKSHEIWGTGEDDE